MTSTLKEKTQTFRELHGPGEFLVLANIWDAVSAKMVERAGARALATTSAGVAWIHGRPDGHGLETDKLLQSVEEIARVTDLPVTADIEGGFSDDAEDVAALTARVHEAGAVGINLEDGTASPDILTAKIAAIKGRVPDLFINARTDVYLRGLAKGDAALEETLTRAKAYLAAGADGIFVPGLADADAIGAIVKAVDAPVNILARAGIPVMGDLRQLGVRRLSLGSFLHAAVLGNTERLAKAAFEGQDLGLLHETAVPYGELNALFPKG